MLRFGNITEIDPVKCYARVTFLDDGIVSAPLQICVMGAINNKFFHIFDINEQVACLMDDNSDEGVIIGAVFNNKTNPDGASADVVRVKFSDNSFIEYDRGTHEYNINIQGKVNIVSTGETHIEAETVSVQASSVTVEADTVDVTATTASVTSSEVEITSPIINIEGVVTVTGSMTVSGAVAAASLAVSGGITGPGIAMESGNMILSGGLTAATVSDGIINLATHKHSGVQTGAGASGPAIP